MIIPSRTCMYCGTDLKGCTSREHVIPRALGGTVKLRGVCISCNSGELSRLDRLLASDAPIRPLACDCVADLQEPAYDYCARTDLALEARILRDYQASCSWAQVILHHDKAFFYTDGLELQRAGSERYLRVFYSRLMIARNTLRDGSPRPRWIWESVQRSPRLGQYLPRVFTKHTFSELTDRIHFVCRYIPPIDQGRMSHQIDNWRPLEGKIQAEQSWGTRSPEGSFCLDSRTLARALVKLGLNLLGQFRAKTPCGPRPA